MDQGRNKCLVSVGQELPLSNLSHQTDRQTDRYFSEQYATIDVLKE